MGAEVGQVERAQSRVHCHGADLGHEGAAISGWPAVNGHEDIPPLVADDGSLAIYRDVVAAPDQPSLRDALLAGVRTFGFSAVFYLNELTRDPTSGRILINQGFPDQWARQYKRRLRLIDPLPDYAMDVMHMFRWGSVLKTIPLSPAQQRYHRFLEEMGMGDGLAIAVWGPGGRCGFMACGMARDECAFGARSYVGIHLLAQMGFNRHCSLLEDLTAGEIRLSPRELEILHWAARGKSNPDMATILGISRATVDTYMRRVFQKFGTNDRTVACLRAHELGFIHASTLTMVDPTLH